MHEIDLAGRAIELDLDVTTPATRRLDSLSLAPINDDAADLVTHLFITDYHLFHELFLILFHVLWVATASTLILLLIIFLVLALHISLQLLELIAVFDQPLEAFAPGHVEVYHHLSVDPVQILVRLDDILRLDGVHAILTGYQVLQSFHEVVFDFVYVLVY